MRKTTEAWLKKADGDFRMMKTLMAANDDAQFDGVCYHAQQAIEELLKALCIEQSIKFPRTHDLGELFELLAHTYPSLQNISSELDELSGLGSDFRYPDEFASRAEARRAHELCTKCRDAVREILGPTEGMLFP